MRAPPSETTAAILGALAVVSLVAIGGGAHAEEEQGSRVVCPRGATVPGIDVSKHQETIRWQKVSAAGVRFAFIRVSDGIEHPDLRFADNWTGARAAGLLRGAYQYFRPGEDARAQARLLLRAVGRLRAGDLPPVLDVETLDGQPPGEVVARMRTWLARVAAQTGRTPILYTNASTWLALDEPDLGGYPLFIAHWDAACPTVLAGWDDWLLWQHSASGRVRGVAGPVDLDWFQGSLEELRELAGIAPPRRRRPRTRGRPAAAVRQTASRR